VCGRGFWRPLRQRRAEGERRRAARRGRDGNGGRAEGERRRAARRGRDGNGGRAGPRRKRRSGGTAPGGWRRDGVRVWLSASFAAGEGGA
jgi:hypothetical protein